MQFINPQFLLFDITLYSHESIESHKIGIFLLEWWFSPLILPGISGLIDQILELLHADVDGLRQELPDFHGFFKSPCHLNKNLMEYIYIYIYPMDPSTFLGSVWGTI